MPTEAPQTAPPPITPAVWSAGWTWVQWLMLIVCLLAIIVLIYIAVRIIIRQVKLRRMVGTMREDLLLRRELAAMAAGKDLEAQHKEQFMRTESIRMDMAAAQRAMAAQGINPRRTGSWLLLGEPGSGKSRLMEYGGIPYPVGVNDFTRAAEITSTFNLWMTEKGSVWDIGGRTFLSRWGGRQDQEWQLFLTEFNKIYRGALPSGVVLTIPADALLLDPPELRNKKATLIAEELRTLSRITGAYCPVWVVITKCDLIDGFSEFGALLDEEDCERTLGWQNPDAAAVFDPAKATAGFDAIAERLRTIRAAMALNEKVWEKAAGDGGRAGIVTPVYLMPERFAGMRDSLAVYLSAIFTHIRHTKDARGLFRFEGFWFVAALDKPVTAMEKVVLEKESGKLQPVMLKADDAAAEGAAGGGLSVGDRGDLVSVHETILSTASDRHYFTKELWQRRILQTTGLSRYTAKAVSRMRRPYWIGVLALLALAVPLALVSNMKQEKLEKLSARDSHYWSSIRTLMTTGAVAEAKLIMAERERQISLTEEPVPSTRITRRDFLYNMSNMATLAAELPLFWRPAAWWVDDEKSDTLFGSDKAFINKATLVSMFLKPVVDSARAVISYRADHYAAQQPPWVGMDTEMLTTLLRISRLGIIVSYDKTVPDDIPYTTLVDLRDSPSRDAAIKSLWMNSISMNDSLHRMSQLNGYLTPVSMEAALAISKGVALYCAAVEALEIYPELNFCDMKAYLRKMERMLQLRDAMRKHEEGFAQAVRHEDYPSMAEHVKSWVEAFNEADAMEDDLIAMESQLGIRKAPSLRDSVTEVQNTLYKKLTADMNRFVSLGSGIRDSENTRFLRSQVVRLQSAITRALPRVAADCDSIISERMCKFWDRREAEADAPHPWENFMANARELYALFTYPVSSGSSEETFHRRLVRLQETKKRYDMRVEHFCKTGDTVLDEACWQQNWRILERHALRRCLADAPHSNVDVPLPGTAVLTGRKLPALPFTMAGSVNTNPRFDPMRANARIADLAELTAYVRERCADGESEDDIMESVRVVDEATKHYLLDYVLYWSETIPAQYKIRGIRTWAQFVESGDILYAADVPGVLYDVSALLIEALTIPCLQDAGRFPEVVENVEHVRRAQKMLTTETRRSMNHAAHFISKLPLSAHAAWLHLSDMPVEKYFNSYWGSWYANDTETTFLWWNDYLEIGMNLLKHEAAEAEHDVIRSIQPYASKFPICRASLRGRSEILSLYELADMDERLGRAFQSDDARIEEDIAKQASARNIPQELASLKLPLYFRDTAAWQKISATLDLLASPEAPLTCELVLPPSEVRRVSVSGEDNVRRLVPVGYRFSYGRITCNGAPLTKLFSLNKQLDNPVDICHAPLPADRGDLQFEFYQHSNSAAPDSVLRVDGAWSALNLYLRPGSRLMDDKKTAYVPIVFRDREGYSCVFWMGLRFNREMIPPNEWLNGAAFDTQSSPSNDLVVRKELELRKAIRSAFLTPRNVPREVSPAERSALLQDISDMLGSGYKVDFEIVLASAAECPDEARLQAAAVYPYFTAGTAHGSTGKLHAVPDATQCAEMLLPGKEGLLLRLYRHANEEFSAMYLQQQEPLLNYVLRKATAYAPMTGFFTVPISASNGSYSITYTLYLRPVVSAAADDGLFPEDSPYPYTDYADLESLPE